MTRFNWLHLTDLHFGLSGQSPLWPNVKQEFFKDLATTHEHTGPWDVVLFSGDFVQQGSKEEFNKLNEQVIHPLWERMKELGSTPHLLAVPGNHDLIRPQGRKSAALRQLLQKDGFVQIADDFFEQPNGEYRSVVSAAFREYAAWWENAPFRHPAVRSGALPGDFSVSIEVDSMRIGVVGLNTTFLQLEGGDFKNRLAWDVRQFHAATTGKLDGDGPSWVEGQDLCLLMTHQGPEWLDDHSRTSVSPEINPAGRFAVHLFGHMHENIVQGTSDRGGEMRWQWQGNSLFGMEKYGDPPVADRRHGYSAGTIQFGSRSTTLRHWPRKAVKDANGWRIDRDTQGCKLDDRDGGTKAVQLSVPKRKPVTSGKKSVKVDTGQQPVPPAYIRWLTDQCADITPLGMKPTPGQSVCLQQVYVPPVITQRLESEAEIAEDGEAQEIVGRRRKKRSDKSQSSLMTRGVTNPESSLQLLLHRLGEQSLYVSGDPGTGKSTFCRWVSWLSATGNEPSFAVAAPEEFQETLPESLRNRLPVVVRLREFAEYIPGHAGRRSLTANQLQSSLENWLKQTKPGGLNWNAVGPRLKDGSVLLILDGVDELPLSAGEGAASWSPRECVITGLTAAATEWQTAGNRILVTSRPYGLEPDQVRALDRCGLPEARLENLPEPLQDLLATRWFVALPKPDRNGAQFAISMLQDVRSHSQDLTSLVRNPLLLTAICIIYDQGQKLPDDIHDLYDQIVSASLHSRYPRNPPDIAKVRFRLGAVALGMHTGNPFEPNRSAPSPEVSLPELDKILAAHLGANPLSESGFCDQVAAREDLLGRSGLLTQGSSQRASFFHLSFQEFLAAEQLTRRSEGLEELLQVIVQRAEMASWRPTLRFLLSRRATEKTPEAVLELLEQMRTNIDVDDVGKFKGLTLSVVDGLGTLLDRKLPLQGPVRDQFVNVFLKAIEQNVEVKARAELALMLGRLGDPRVPETLDDSNAWVTVPAGTYVFGDENQRFEIERPFRISKFPVTNAQFAAFVADGYHTESLWHPAGWMWRSSNNITQPEYWDDSTCNGATCPVVGVSWWEADAFCRWAGVRLATEHEWEAAARGPAGSKYPWGNHDIAGLCNSAEIGLGRTSPVGIFPPSVSHCGAHDMAGNVWEWCSDHYDPARQKDDNASRVLRGGSWGDGAGYCRSSIRLDDGPDDRNFSIGFRVARTL